MQQNTLAVESNERYIVRALDAEGRESFYNGRAGAGWVSADRAEVFEYSQEGARRKALLFNRATQLHGLWFIAVPKEVN